MKTRFPLLLTSLVALALAAPEAMAKDDGKDKGKDKKKDKVERTDQDRDGRDRDRDGRDHDHDGDDRDGNGKVTICHIPPGNAGARHTITVSESAWDAHRKHGDRRGACDHGHDGDGHRRFEDLDRDHDNRLSRSEFPGGREAFDRLNRNHDDWLSREEFDRF
jgi:hypothetical protein